MSNVLVFNVDDDTVVYKVTDVNVDSVNQFNDMMFENMDENVADFVSDEADYCQVDLAGQTEVDLSQLTVVEITFNKLMTLINNKFDY